MSTGPLERGADEGRAAAPDGRFVVGDPIRGLGALMIIVYHAAYAVLLEVARANPELTSSYDFYGVFYGELLGPVIRNLDFSIYLFLVLSGYLIGRPFIRAYVSGDAHPRLRPYLQNRMLRIFPAFWAITTIVLIRHGTVGSGAGDVVAVYAMFQTYVESNFALLMGPGWTVNVEWCYYLLVPVTAWVALRLGAGRLDRRGRVWLVAAVLAVAWFGSLAAAQWMPDTLVWKRSLPALLYGFVPGLALALVEIDLAPRARAQGRGAGAAYLLVAAGFACVVAYGVVLGTAQGFLPGVGAGPRVLAALAATCVVAAPLVHQWSGRRPWRVLDNKPLHWLGTRSYSAYLIHTAVLLEVYALLEPAGTHPRRELALVLLVAVPLVCLAGWICFRLFEHPFLQRRHRWRT